MAGEIGRHGIPDQAVAVWQQPDRRRRYLCRSVGAVLRVAPTLCDRVFNSIPMGPSLQPGKGSPRRAAPCVATVRAAEPVLA
jgi:hypothetical protein